MAFDTVAASITRSRPGAKEFPVTEFRRQLERWFVARGRDLPWRKGTDPYGVLVSEMMCQQTTVAAVVPYFRRWMERWPTVRALAAASEAEVLAAWEGLGYYSRGRNLWRAAREIMELPDAEVPRTFAELRRLPGVGDYTANAVLAFAFDEAAPVIDANVARVLARLFDFRAPIDDATGRDWLRAAAVELQAGRSGGGRLFNSALMELGALVCRARVADCAGCPVRQYCRAEAPLELPKKRARREVTRLTERREWILEGDDLWLEESAGPRWRGMWILPLARAQAGGELLHLERYPITRYFVAMEVVAGMPREGLRRVATRDLEKLAVPAPHRRVIRKLLNQ